MLKLPGILYRNKFHIPPLPPPDSFKDQHILVTGGNCGIGQAFALHCLNLGAASVIITSRDAANGEASKQYIQEQTTGKGTLEVMHLDMSTFAGVKGFVDKLKQDVKVLDVVYLNAGALNMPGYPLSATKDGWEKTLQVNALSTALLAILLLPWLKLVGRGNSHLVFAGSGRHRGLDTSPEGGFPQTNVLQHWHSPENYKKVDLYPIGKLFVEYTMREIAKLATDVNGRPQVIVNSMCPGMVQSYLARDAFTNRLMTFASKSALSLVFKTAEDGAKTPVWVALMGPEANGKFFAHYTTEEEYEKNAEKNIFSPHGQKMQTQVWGEIVALLAETVPEVKEIVGLV